MELNLDENKNKKCIENIGFASGGIFEIKKSQIIGYLWIFLPLLVNKTHLFTKIM